MCIVYSLIPPSSRSLKAKNIWSMGGLWPMSGTTQGRVEKGWNWVAECSNIGKRYTRRNVLFPVLFLRWRGERYIPKNVVFLH